MNEPIHLLHRHFSLTPAEARLALHLVAEETLRSAAVKLSISYETARTCLKPSAAVRGANGGGSRPRRQSVLPERGKSATIHAG